MCLIDKILKDEKISFYLIQLLQISDSAKNKTLIYLRKK